MRKMSNTTYYMGGIIMIFFYVVKVTVAGPGSSAQFKNKKK